MRDRRWLQITLGIIGGLIVLLLINAFVVSNQTKSAYVRDEGAQLVETSAGTLQVMDEGNPQGSPIVLVHCYTCSMEWWQKLAPLLSKDHRVIRVDLLGHGGSDKPGGGYAIEDQARAVTEALAKLDVVDATVVGHSLGGCVVTATAQASPRLASRVVIIDQAVNNDDAHTSFAQNLGYVPVIGEALNRVVHWAPASTVRSQYGEAFAPDFSISAGFENPDQVVDDLRVMTYTAYTDAPDAETDYTDEKPLNERLAETGLPVLVMFGSEDQIYDAGPSLAPYKDIPGVQTRLIDGAGHSPNVEKPNEVAPLILAFAQAPPPQATAPKPAKQKQGSGKQASGKQAGQKKQSAPAKK